MATSPVPRSPAFPAVPRPRSDDRLLAAFEQRAVESGAHLAEFWTDDPRSEGLLAALGWRRIFVRDGYLGRRTWSLMEKVLSETASPTGPA